MGFLATDFKICDMRYSAMLKMRQCWRARQTATGWDPSCWARRCADQPQRVQWKKLRGWVEEE